VAPQRRLGVLRRAVLFLLRAAPGQVAIVAVAAVALAAAPIATAWCLKAVFDVLADPVQRSGSALLVPVAASFATALVTAVASGLHSLGSARVVRAVRIRAQHDLFAVVDAVPWLSDLEQPAFQNSVHLAERAADDTARRLLTSGITVISATLQGVGWLVSVMAIWPPMVVLLALGTIPYLWLGHRTARRQAELQERLVPNGRLRMFLRGLLVDPRAAKESRLFGVGPYLRSRMATLLRDANQQEDAVERTVERTEIVLAGFGAACTAAATLAAAIAADSRSLSVGDLSLFLAAAVGAQAAIASASAGYTGAVGALMVIPRYFGFIDRVPTPRYDAARPAHAPLGGIELRNVWFRYDPDGPWVLEDVNLRIPSGSKIGITGPNGAGKSTLVKLICQLYQPTRGEILYDGVPARTVEPASIQRGITAVFQDFMTYDLTVAENIAIGDIGRLDDRDALRRAAELVGLHDEIQAMPGGYDTLLSKIFIADEEDAGVSLLSGGQWQRLAIARALLRPDATIAVLDEPASGLDAFAQHRLRQIVSSLGTDRTVLLISHHLSSIRRMDSIVVVDGGRITGHAPHDELMRTGGTYAQLFSLQADGYTA
jgi:ATP-binding cassette subfamily B protein